MKDSLVDRFTSSREDQWIPKRQVFQVLRKFPLYLPTFSVDGPPLPLFFHPRHGRWPKRRVKREKKELKETLAAVRWMYYMSWWFVEQRHREKRRDFLNQSKENLIPVTWPIYDVCLNSLRLFINSRDEIICAPGSLHILQIKGRRVGARWREKERGGGGKKTKRKRMIETCDLVSANIRMANGDSLFVNANRRRIRFNGKKRHWRTFSLFAK